VGIDLRDVDQPIGTLSGGERQCVAMTEVMGRDATVRIDHPQYRNYEWRTPGSVSIGPPRDFEERFPDAYASELEAFARCVRDGRAPR